MALETSFFARPALSSVTLFTNRRCKSVCITMRILFVNLVCVSLAKEYFYLLYFFALAYLPVGAQPDVFANGYS